MHGYLRRKATYNLGKAGNRKIIGPSLSTAEVTHNPNVLAMIHDEAGMIYTDIDYCRNGVKEGWLILDGWHRNDNDDIVYRYTMNPAP